MSNLSKLTVILLSILTYSCSALGYMTVNGDLTHGIFFGVSTKGEEHRIKSVHLYDINVTTVERGSNGLVDPLWRLHGDAKGLNQIQYGVIPSGFKETAQALPLQINTTYRVSASGSVSYGLRGTYSFMAGTCFHVNADSSVEEKPHC
ncbi:hypothetical protein [Aquirhabdus parva]|uniref:Uncharacterized protein n=1 Tax=Aquirhabdus parva TaxID=2283318 RepID=A0A345P954_9GAMM|nr:hypothetical protein [Aquirhabdus parva]AXI03813.1 hypothetical protein HYN46_13800 [Aquirhabdus parva]